VPTSTDLVKDGAVAIETLGDSIDASLVDLKGGTTGQVLAKTTGTDMDFTWTTALSGSTNVAGKNNILNSGMNVAQRGTSFTIASSTATYTLDRWQAYRTATGMTVTQQNTSDTTNLPFIQKCVRLARDSGTTSTVAIQYVQTIETANSIPYAGKSVTLSFYARAGANYSPTSSALLVYLQTGTGTDQNYINGFTGATNIVSGSTATLTTTWQRFTFTATVGATATQLAVALNMNPTGTAGANDYCEVTGFQLEAASAATAYSPNAATFQGELAACQRYYFRLGGNQVYQVLGGGTANGTTQCDVQTPLPVTMRVIPSSVDYATLALQQKGGSPLNAVTSVTLGLQSPSLANTSFNVASGLTDGAWHRLMTNNSTSAYLAYNAEL
jgi:hypothetical protein